MSIGQVVHGKSGLGTVASPSSQHGMPQGRPSFAGCASLRMDWEPGCGGQCFDLPALPVL
eukprot:358784-Chlamydomonas_euryale.AAC.11